MELSSEMRSTTMDLKRHLESTGLGMLDIQMERQF
jgi:hypothetical protein